MYDVNHKIPGFRFPSEHKCMLYQYSYMDAGSVLTWKSSSNFEKLLQLSLLLFCFKRLQVFKLLSSLHNVFSFASK
jgi:hypothetical protein